MKYVNLLTKIATKAGHAWAWHAVLVESGGRILAQGHNHGTTHAEVNALNKLWPSERIGTKVWSMRVTRSGKLAMARPCPECEAYLRKNGIKTVWYSTEAGDFKKMKLG